MVVLHHDHDLPEFLPFFHVELLNCRLDPVPNRWAQPTSSHLQLELSGRWLEEGNENVSFNLDRQTD